MNPETVKFQLGETVYHKVDDDPGLVTAIVFRSGCVRYEVCWRGRVVEEHDDIELSRQKTFAGTKEKDDDA